MEEATVPTLERNMTATDCTNCGGWGCRRCLEDVRAELEKTKTLLGFAMADNEAFKKTLERVAREGEEWRRKYEALICASRGVGYE
jgi:hypothetical protein